MELYVDGRRMQVNAIAGYESSSGTATLFLDATPNSGAGCDETQFDNPLWQEIFSSQTAGVTDPFQVNDFTQINDLGYGLVVNNAHSNRYPCLHTIIPPAMYANNGPRD